MNKLLTRFLNNKKTEYLLLALILILAFGARLYKINSPIADWHSWRQVDTAAVARIYVDHGIDLLHPKYYDISSVQTGYFNPEGHRFVEFPLYNLLHAVGYMSFPALTFDVWGRLISIFASLVTILLVYLIGKRVEGKWTGMVAAFLVAFIPFSVYYSRVILPEPMATMFAILAVYLYLLFHDSEKNRYLYFSSLALGVSLLIKPYTAFYALPILYLAWKKYGIKKIITSIPFLLALDFVLVPFLAWRAWMNQFFVGIPHFAWVFNGDKIRFRPAFWRWIFTERLGHLILGTWGILPFVLGIVRSKKLQVFELMILGMFLYVSIVATASVRHDYYQSIAIPAVALIVARGFVYLWSNKEFNKWLSRAVAVFTLGMMLFIGFYQVKEYYKVNHPEFVEVGNIVHNLVPQDAKVLAPDNGNTVFLYYTRRFGWPILEESIDEVIEKGADYYVSVTNDQDTSMLKNKFETLSQGSNYVILDLSKRK